MKKKGAQTKNLNTSGLCRFFLELYKKGRRVSDRKRLR